MASRRMFSLRIINTARFLKMPISSQALYFHLGLHADDDGIVEAFTVIKSTGCSEDDLRVLVSKGFVQVLNEDLVAYITDWNENNQIRADRKIDSIYKDLLISMIPDIKLIEKTERADVKKKHLEDIGQPLDNQWTDIGQPMDNQLTTNGQPVDGIGKDSIGKVSKGKVRLGKDRSTIEAFTDNEDLKDAIDEFLKMRKAIKKPMTERALTLMLNKLSQLSSDEEEQIEILNQSIEHNWQTVYPIKEKTEQKVERDVISHDWDYDALQRLAEERSLR